MIAWLRRRLGPAPPWDEAVYWALDLETSGLDPARDAILSVGMVPVRRGVVPWGERFYTLVRPPDGKATATAATAVHRILPAELAAAPASEEVVAAVDRRLAGGVLLAHHARLDVAFLRRAYRRAGHRWPRPPVIDTRDLVRRLEFRLHRLDPWAAPLPRSLAGIRSHLGLPDYEPHHALADALATAELFLALRSRLGIERLGRLPR
jgi:DNA polymerase-3 subunit epsilon